MGASVFLGRNFTSSSGAGVPIGSANEITSNDSVGNVQETGTIPNSTTANYIYNGTSAQVTGSGFPATVNNLTINNSSGVSLSADVTVAGTLALTSGKITTGSYELKATNTTTSSVTGYSSSSYVVGNLRRSVAASGSYDFPVGNSANYELINITLSSITRFTDILGTFTNSNPIETLLPLAAISIGGPSLTQV